MSTRQKVAIIGASNKPDRYAYKALKRLQDNGYDVLPIHPVLEEIEGVPVYKTLSDISDDVYAVTIYVRPQTGEKYIEQLIALQPEKIIMNPGTESDELERQCGGAGIMVQRACTLVLLASGQFEN